MSSPSKCANCREKIINDGRHMSCVDCKNSYHVGKLCSGIADSTFKTMGAAKREIWRCRRCREQSREPGSQSETGLSQWESPVTGEHFRSLESKLDCLTSLKANVDSLLSLPAKIDQLLTLKPVVENLKSALTEIQKSVDFLSESYDSLLLTATANASSVTELRNETTSLREIVTEQSKTIEHLQDELNDSDQYSRHSNLEIHGLPCSSNENLITVVNELASKLGLADFQRSDIVTMHRLPSRRDIPPPILVRFSTAALRDQWLSTRKKLRPLSENGSLPKLFFNENLTRRNKELVWKLREKVRDTHYKFTWVKNGKLFAKKTESSPAVRIHRFADLEKIV